MEVYGVPAESLGIRELDINRAVDQSTWQHNTYQNRYVSSFAADGNFDPWLDQNSCAMMNGVYKGWWAVDLEESFQLNRATLTTTAQHSK